MKRALLNAISTRALSVGLNSVTSQKRVDALPDNRRPRGGQRASGNSTGWLMAVVIASVSVLGVTEAQADVINANFSFPDINNLSSASPAVTENTSVSQFNPALGTLTSVSISDTANLTWVGAGSSTNQFAVAYSVDSTGQGGSPFCANPCTFTVNPLVDASILSDFIGTGTVAASVTLTNASSSFLLDATFTDAVTYTYTPAAASIPEPSALSVFMVGLFGLGGFWLLSKLRGQQQNLCGGVSGI
jgi:hypothetical protein